MPPRAAAPKITRLLRWPVRPKSARSITSLNLIADLPEAEAVGRRRLAGRCPIAGPQDGGHVAGPLLAPAHLDHGADQRADHLVAEGAGLDLEAEHAVAEVVP